MLMVDVKMMVVVDACCVVIVVCVNATTPGAGAHPKQPSSSCLCRLVRSRCCFSHSHFSYKEDCSVNVSFRELCSWKKDIPGRGMVGCVCDCSLLSFREERRRRQMSAERKTSLRLTRKGGSF